MDDPGTGERGRTLAVMQPYLLPYIGYWQLLGAVDTFVIYDNIKYTKKGWINRNRLLQGGADAVFSLPLAGASDALEIRQREVAPTYEGGKLLQRFAGAYRRAPFFAQTMPWLERILLAPERNLFRFLMASIVATCEHLGLRTRILVSSQVPGADHALKGQERVLSLCHAVGARTYLNAIGGTALYARDEFQAHGVDLRFLRARTFEYRQFGSVFVPWLSIVDVLMFNPLDAVLAQITCGYDLV